MLFDLVLFVECIGVSVHFEVLMRSGRRERKGMLGGQGFGSPGWLLGVWIDATNWIQFGLGKYGWFLLWWLIDLCRLIVVEQVGDDLVLHGRFSFDEFVLFLSCLVVGGEEEILLEVDGRDFIVRLLLWDIFDVVNYDDLFGCWMICVFWVYGPEEE